MRRKLVCIALLWAASASAQELRVGGQYAGHLLFTDVAGAEVEWPAVRRGDRTFLHEIAVEAGLATSFDGELLAVPALVRAEVLHRWNLGLDLAAGVLVTHFRDTSAMTAMVCAGVPFTYERFRLQPELCANLAAGPPGGFSYRGGLWTGLGVGAFYAF
jgi:hypothetical protein